MFIVVSVVLLAALRPLARSHRRQPASLRTGTAALVGRKGTVVERIANDENSGCVRLEGETLDGARLRRGRGDRSRERACM